MLTASPYPTWGIHLYEALPINSQPRSIADSVTEEGRTGPAGYGAMARALMKHYQPYLETELEVCWYEVQS